MKSWYQIRAVEGGAEVLIYDEIGLWGVTAKQFITDLQALGEIAALTVRINSPGGDVFDGWAIFNALQRVQARKTVWIDGWAASMASVIAMVGDEIVMPDNAMMMIHEPMWGTFGTAAELRAAAETLDKITTCLVGAYAARSKRDDAEIRQMMADETWLSAAEAVALGFADVIAAPVKMVARFDLSKFRRPPAAMAPEPDATEGAVPSPADDLPPPAEPDPADIAESPRDPGLEIPPPAADRAAALAYALEVTELCALAGLPDRAAAFIRAETRPQDVRRALQQARADAEPEIDASRPVPRGFRVETQTLWGKVIDRINGQA